MSEIPSTTNRPNVLKGLLMVWPVVSVAVMGGSLFGFGIGMTAIYDEMTTEILDCSRYNSGSGTCPVDTGYCVLVGTACIFPHRDLCSTSSMTGKPLTYSECVAVDAGLGGLVADASTTPYRYYSSCQWVSNKCEATNEIPSSRLGLIGSILTIGAVVGASGGSYALRILGHRRVVTLAGCVALLTAIVTHLNPFGYVSLVSMRFVYGAASGLMCVAAPTYVDIHTPQSLRDVAGCLFQISITLGIAITAVVGYVVSDTDGVVSTSTFQAFLAISTIFASLLIAVGVFAMQDSPAHVMVVSFDGGVDPSVEDSVAALNNVVASISGKGAGGLSSSIGTGVVMGASLGASSGKGSPHLAPSDPTTQLGELSPSTSVSMSAVDESTLALPAAEAPNAPLLSFWYFKNPSIKAAFITVTVMLLVVQFTGINAVMNYAPRIAKSMGVPPMLGNAVIMVWNFVTTLAAVPLASMIPLRKLFLTGLIVLSCGCGVTAFGSFIAGGGVTGAFVSFLSSVGIALFIAGFETGMAPAGFVLVQRAYPPHLGGDAMGYYNAAQNLAGFVLVMCFPVVSDALSSIIYGAMDSSVDQALNEANSFASAILFGMFAAVGLIGWAILKRRLP